MKEKSKDRKSTSTAEATRLEDLWKGQFGDAYIERNRSAGAPRAGFWEKTLQEFSAQSILEVGCNVGTNLCWCQEHVDPQHVYGVDISPKALREIRSSLPEVNAIWAPARQLPFRDSWFDMVFTMGVLIHQPESTLPLVMAEVVRCSSRYILCGEYFAEGTCEITYHGQSGALFKRNYGQIYQDLWPELQLHKHGFLAREEGWDDITYWIFEKP